MDGIHRKGKYQDLMNKLNRIHASNKSDDPSEKYELLQQEVNSIIESLRNRGDQSNSKIHYVLLIVPLTLILIWIAVTSNQYTSAFLIIIFMTLALILAHLRTSIAIKKSHEAQKSMGVMPTDSKNFIKTKLSYLGYAMEIKKTRLVLVSVFYMLFFPILLVKLHELAIGLVPFNNPVTAYVVAYLLGTTLWFLYYSKAFDIYDDIEEQIGLIEKNL